MLQLNIGCGESKLDGFVNIDCFGQFENPPDLILDVTKELLPYENGAVDQIWMAHSIEHIEMKKWDFIFREFYRVLKPNGVLMLSYPEFKECAKRFIEDLDGKRNFWRMTLYGRQLWPSDFHVTPMHSPELKNILFAVGFYRINYQPESVHEPYNTIMKASKDPSPTTREDVLAREIGLLKEIVIEDGVGIEDSVK